MTRPPARRCAAVLGTAVLALMPLSTGTAPAGADTAVRAGRSAAVSNRTVTVDGRTGDRVSIDISPHTGDRRDAWYLDTRAPDGSWPATGPRGTVATLPATVTLDPAATYRVTVRNIPPATGWTIGPPFTLASVPAADTLPTVRVEVVLRGGLATATYTATDPDGTPNVILEWGDSEAVDPVPAGIANVAQHVYPGPGEYIVRVTAFQAGQRITARTTVTVVDPLAALSARVAELEREVAELQAKLG